MKRNTNYRNIIAMMFCSLTFSIYAGINDGTFLGSSALIENGPANLKMNIVFMGDGYQEDEQDVFNAKVESVMNHLFSSHPFYAMRCAMNVIRINVASKESGVDVPDSCNGGALSDAQIRATAMDATYCSGGRTERCIMGDIPAVSFWAGQAGIVQGASNVFIYVFVNQDKYGGCARFSARVAFGWTGDGYEKTVIHELGHALSGLEDEYDYAESGAFTDSRQLGVNATTSNSLPSIKWNDLILGSTSIPTKSKKCDSDDGQGKDEFDIVGLFEGAIYHTCGVFRPSVTCKMQDSDEAFCSVCRRKVIQDLRPFMCSPSAVNFTEVKIFDDNDPWPKGEGEISFFFRLSSSIDNTSGSWPSSDDTRDFDDDETQNLDNFFAGTMADISTGEIRTEFNEEDWPDGDDDLDDDETNPLPPAGDFTVTSSDYQLKGIITASPMHLLLDMLNVKDDQDWPDDGDIYVKYTIDNGNFVIKGRYPNGDGDVGIGDHETANIGVFAGAIARPDRASSLNISFEVWDSDNFFRGDDDLVGRGSYSFDAAAGFGDIMTTFCKDESNFRISFSVFGSR